MNRNRRLLRRISAAAGCMMLMQSASALPAFAADSSIFCDSFEDGVCGWEGRGGASVAADSKAPYAGSGALAVTGRTDSWNGAQKDISSYVAAGSTYSFSVCVRYETGSNVELMLSLCYKDASGETVYDHIAQETTMSGFYVQLANDSYTVSAGATEPILYVETKSGTSALSIDEAVCAEKGTQIEGPAPVSFTLGDVNYDGTVNGTDFSLAKQIMLLGKSTKATLKAADVNCSGAVEMADIVWYVKFLTGQEKAYPEPEKPAVEPYDYQPLVYHDFDPEYLKDAAQKGQVIQEQYSINGGTNTCYVYLPYGYDESQKYNVFYLMHGGGENEKTLFFQSDTMIQNIVDHMIQNGELAPTIVVTPTWNKSSADTFWSEFREKLVPYIETKYATYAGSGSLEDLVASRYHRAYGGFSMGSISTWGVLMHCLDICAYYMPLSGEYKVNNLSYEQQAQMIGKAIDDSGLGPHEYFIMAATGTNDMAQPQMTPMINELRKLPQLSEGSDLSENNFNYMLVQGKEHWWGHVRHYVYDMLPYFFHEGN